MLSTSPSEGFATSEVAVYFDRSLRQLNKANTCVQVLHNSRRAWSFSAMAMELDTVSFHSNEKQQLMCSSSADNGSKLKEKDVSNSPSVNKDTSTPVFVNHAAIAWHESRRKWVGDQSQHPQRMEKDQIISWSTTYEELLLTNDPFSEPISLTEMVDFLVDIWQDEGLYD
ncbi:hypothetical protein HS088_TW16G00165 [Tripterygium wilfordii]|uniref:Gag1-like clamp domain-containing protein n=1 Tax=Tripterygium wilfordii TaxID=458696 RepID=A0A7J7CI37_TRIWF|nr:uncharacterized protein LOC119980335 [Tripterygium wilfordii]KAF5733725.1 hypothetical protein HS088_TW16G00165 [Tripterygium wilfordii]